MSGQLELARDDAIDHAFRGRRGTWTRVQDAGDALVMTCPECGEAAGLARHQVDSEGVVSPSVVCRRADEGCAFHAFVRLLGWTP